MHLSSLENLQLDASAYRELHVIKAFEVGTAVLLKIQMVFVVVGVTVGVPKVRSAFVVSSTL